MDVTIRPRRADEPEIATIVVAHVVEMDADEQTPSEACHRLEIDGLLAPHITLLGAHDEQDRVVGIAALAEHGDEVPPWGEVKSMHVPVAQRGRGLSRLLLDDLRREARRRGLDVLRLETARSLRAAVGLYRSAGFVERDAFGGYEPHPASVFMELTLDPDDADH